MTTLKPAPAGSVSPVQTDSLYRVIARTIEARDNCEASGNHEWLAKWTSFLVDLMEHLPSGSGFDCGTKLDDSSTTNKLVFTTACHHMNDAGMYDGWTNHTVTVRPSLGHGFTLSISGKDRNGIKELMHEYFHNDLSNEVPSYPSTPDAFVPLLP